MQLQPIEATSIDDAWHTTLFKCLKEGKRFTIDRGSYEGQDRLELDFPVIRIKHPGTMPLLPKVNPALSIPDPVEEGYLDDYVSYLMTDEEKPGEAYTYGQRICAANADNLFQAGTDPKLFIELAELPKNVMYVDKQGITRINQMELLIWTYLQKGHRNNQMILQVGQPQDMILKDPPCLRHIDTRIQNGALHFFPYFRSWDLYGGFPANLAAIELMKQYCAEQIGVKNGEIIASSKGLHIYDYVFELSAAIRGKSLDEFKNIIGG